MGVGTGRYILIGFFFGLADFGPWTRRTVKGIHRPALLPNIWVDVNFQFRAQTVVKDMGPRLFESRHDAAFILFPRE